MRLFKNEKGIAHFLLVAGVAILLAGGTFAAFTANSSKPGDALYSLDRAFESIKLAASLNDEAKARTQFELAEERLQELEQIYGEAPDSDLVKTAADNYSQKIGEAAEAIAQAAQNNDVGENTAKSVAETTKTQLDTVAKVHEKAAENALNSIKTASGDSNTAVATNTNTQTNTQTGDGTQSNTQVNEQTESNTSTSTDSETTEETTTNEQVTREESTSEQNNTIIQEESNTSNNETGSTVTQTNKKTQEGSTKSVVIYKAVENATVKTEESATKTSQALEGEISEEEAQEIEEKVERSRQRRTNFSTRINKSLGNTGDRNRQRQTDLNTEAEDRTREQNTRERQRQSR